MKIHFLESSEAGLRWMKRYYRANPQLDAGKAMASFLLAQKNLADGVLRARPYENFENVFEYSITGTSFSIIYTARPSGIYVIDIRDTRGLRSAQAIKAFEKELLKRLQE